MTSRRISTTQQIPSVFWLHIYNSFPGAKHACKVLFEMLFQDADLLRSNSSDISRRKPKSHRHPTSSDSQCSKQSRSMQCLCRTNDCAALANNDGGRKNCARHALSPCLHLFRTPSLFVSAAQSYTLSQVRLKTTHITGRIGHILEAYKRSIVSCLDHTQPNNKGPILRGFYVRSLCI